ncbi:dapper homolog 1 [Echeneis naucrates]|uniref:Dishevelled binding antagonist of beta catenin 1 n=1 Tax=Echeneis naucrates TaxID=173247 RepID=A0A665UJF4_ECHNA|nr:dapper homolog 1 [Echeneis naucrates]
MLLSVPFRRDGDTERRRSFRDRLGAAVSGLGELELLRRRQELLVRAALELREAAEQQRQLREDELSSGEKLLEENILLLRKQLNCLRRRDTGLISQLQDLDRQISDLRLDTAVSHDQPESDSRPSSGFYELSDGASGSLSNSSNSVFSECFCSPPDADGYHPSTDELPGCLECGSLAGGPADDSCYGPGPAPSPVGSAPTMAPCNSQSKFHCDLVSRNGSDVYRYPSPLHAVAVQSPVFLQMLSHGGHCGDEGLLRSFDVSVEALKPEFFLLPASVSAPLVAPSASSSSCHKRLDGFIYSLLQRRAPPFRTSRPRTSISTDPSKSILRQASLCVRQVSGPSSGSGLGLKGSELKPLWAAGRGPADCAAPLFSQRNHADRKAEEQDTQNGFHGSSDDFKNNNSNLVSSQNRQHPADFQNDSLFPNAAPSSLMNRKSKGCLASAVASLTLPKGLEELDHLRANSTPKESKQPCYPPDHELPHRHKNSPTPEEGDRLVPELVSVGSSSQSQHEAGSGESHMVNANDRGQNIKLRKAARKNMKTRSIEMMRTNRTSEHNEPPETRGEKSHLLEDSTHIKTSRRGPGGAAGVSSSRINKCLSAAVPESSAATLGVRPGTSKHLHYGNHHRHCHHHHQHGRDQVVVIAKPKHKRNSYRRLRAIMEVPYDEAFRRAQRRQRKEFLSRSAADKGLPGGKQLSSLYSYTAGSDSEYSAECASLFHSTIVDTSEDERSNYTTNRFGDSESSDENYVYESATTSDTEESGEGGAGGWIGGLNRGRRQLGAPGARARGQEMTPAQVKTYVKIKASHNLKKKILRFRSGSLKLMTTV